MSDDDDAPPVPANIAALERAAARALLEEDDIEVEAAAVEAIRELARLMEAGDRGALLRCSGWPACATICGQCAAARAGECVDDRRP